MSKIAPFAGLVITFIVAYACDRWVEFMQVQAYRTFVLAPYLWLAGVANLILAIALLLLTWHVLFWANKSRLVSTIFALVGLAFTFSAAINMSLPSPFPAGIVEFSTPGSHVLYVAAFVAVIGIAGFILPRRSSV